MREIDTTKIIDNARFNGFHWRVLLWSTLILIFDGYDLVVYGVVLPSLMQDWSLVPAQAGMLGSSALFGMMFGALVLGPVADRYGRKPVIASGVVMFSLFTVLTGFTTDVLQFAICRFVAGFAIGGVMPNAVALISEFAPRKLRSTLVAIMFSGYSVGGMLSAGLGVALLPKFGWQSVFYVAAIPVVLLPFILKALPESVIFSVRKGRTASATRVLELIDPSLKLSPTDTLYLPPKDTATGRFVDLFSGSRLVPTLLLWSACFCCLLMIYALSSWLPKLMLSAGYGLGSSITFLMILNLGAIVGAIAGGWLGDRFKLRNVLIGLFIAAAISISALGYSPPVAVLYILVAVAGASTIGAQILVWALVAQFYPSSIRSTGLGWASAIGRTGAIVGPLLGGFMLGREFPLQINFIVFGVPGAIAALAMAMMVKRDTTQAPEPSAQVPSANGSR